MEYEYRLIQLALIQKIFSWEADDFTFWGGRRFLGMAQTITQLFPVTSLDFQELLLRISEKPDTLPGSRLRSLFQRKFQVKFLTDRR